jgi:hypothetical protein
MYHGTSETLGTFDTLSGQKLPEKALKTRFLHSFLTHLSSKNSKKYTFLA